MTAGQDANSILICFLCAVKTEMPKIFLWIVMNEQSIWKEIQEMMKKTQKLHKNEQSMGRKICMVIV